VHIQYSTFFEVIEAIGRSIGGGRRHVLGVTGHSINVMQSGRCNRVIGDGDEDGSFRRFALDLLMSWVRKPDFSGRHTQIAFRRLVDTQSRCGWARPRSSCKPSHCTKKSRIFGRRTSHIKINCWSLQNGRSIGRRVTMNQEKISSIFS
jgi:hypothetical protein